MSNTVFFTRVLAALLGLGISLPGYAASLNVTALPAEASGPFQHNAFYRANSHHSLRGPVLAWFDLGATDTGSWDTGSGDFSLSVQLFADHSLTKPAGTASATGNLSVSAFNGQDGGLLGTLTWDFSNAVDSYLKHLGSATISFLDVNYATSTGGYNANSIDGGVLTLLGAAGHYNAVTGQFNTRTTTIGMNMVARFDHDIASVPVPASVWLFGFGLVGLSAIARRRDRITSN